MSSKKPHKRIFLDYASITPVAPEVQKAMEVYSAQNFANPSALYDEGRRAKETMLSCRKKIAEIFSSHHSEIIFTSGGTEGNNLALLGVFEQAKRRGVKIPHVITTTIEHPAILEVCHEIERRGGEVTYIKVSEDGLVSPKDISTAIKENTVLVSIMYANNEIGTIQPIKEISRRIKEYRQKHASVYPYIHTDACQAGLFLPLNVLALGVDLLTLDGIKMYGPRGMGLLYVKAGVDIRQLFFGGGQERGFRSGTENVLGIVGLTKALEIAEQMKESESARLLKIRDHGIEQILKHFPQAELNGSQIERLPNNINICFPDSDSEFIVVALDVEGIAVSYSSTCRTLKEDSSSYVISALGREGCALSSLRITLGRDTVSEDIDALVIALKKIIE